MAWLGRRGGGLLMAGVLLLAGCRSKAAATEAGYDGVPAGKEQASDAAPSSPPAEREAAEGKAAGQVGFDRNDYPGDDAMALLHKSFAFTGYWLTPPPEAATNSWLGKRELLKRQGWGFLLLANGKLDKEILRAQKAGTQPAELGRKDAAVAVAAAKSEGFPRGAIVFLDQEEGGRLLEEQAAYLLGWTEAVAATDYRPGVYASGQLVQDDPGVMIDTIRDIRARVKAAKLHEVAMFDAQDSCPPAPGCTLAAKPLHEAGEPDLVAWQYAQSPRRPEITKSCAATYASDGSCYAPDVPGVFLDLNVARDADPSRGR